MRVTVVVPTYNEAEQHRTAVSRGPSGARPTAGILIVDDGSPDGTADLAEHARSASSATSTCSAGPARTGWARPIGPGLRPAIDDGAEICVQMDADLSHDPAVLPALIANVEHGADLAIGSRYVPGGITENWPRRRRWLSRWGNRYAAGVLGLAINDATAGYRAYRAEALETMDVRNGRGRGVRLPDRDDVPTGARRRQGRRVPDHVSRSHRGRVEDVGRHHQRGAGAGRSSCGSPTSAAVVGVGARAADRPAEPSSNVCSCGTMAP